MQLPVGRGARGDGRRVKVDDPTPDLERWRGKCRPWCGCPRCRIDAELEARQWEELGCWRWRLRRARVRTREGR